MIPDNTQPASPKKPKTARRRAREFVVQGLYEWQVNPADLAVIEYHLRENEEFARADIPLLRELLYGAVKEHTTLQTRLEPHVSQRQLSEMSTVEKAVLWMAAFELIFKPETPCTVIINEAVEVNKVFGGIEGYKFVNGVLDRLSDEVRPGEGAHYRGMKGQFK